MTACTLSLAKGLCLGKCHLVEQGSMMIHVIHGVHDLFMIRIKFSVPPSGHHMPYMSCCQLSPWLHQLGGPTEPAGPCKGWFFEKPGPPEENMCAGGGNMWCPQLCVFNRLVWWNKFLVLHISLRETQNETSHTLTLTPWRQASAKVLCPGSWRTRNPPA